MGTRLMLLADVLLIVAMVALGARLYELRSTEPPPRPLPAPATAPQSARPTRAPADAGSRPALATFAVVAEKNLFSPERTEVVEEPPKPAPKTAPVGKTQKPRLWGIVLGAKGGPRAFLEDPGTRKVFSYATGDSVAGSRVEEIKPDRVVLRQGDTVFEVLLRDPTKPRPRTAPARRARAPAPQAVPAQIPGTGRAQPPRGTPGVIPTRPQIPPAAIPPVPGQPRARPGSRTTPSVQGSQ